MIEGKYKYVGATVIDNSESVMVIAGIPPTKALWGAYAVG